MRPCPKCGERKFVVSVIVTFDLVPVSVDDDESYQLDWDEGASSETEIITARCINDHEQIIEDGSN